MRALLVSSASSHHFGETLEYEVPYEWLTPRRLNFSKGASQVIGQYYQLIRLGKKGYRAIMSNLTRTADYLSEALEALGFVIMSKRSGEGLPLVAFRFKEKEDRHYDEFALAHKLVSTCLFHLELAYLWLDGERGMGERKNTDHVANQK